jgi:excisionase family DNA binding protein
MPNTTAPDRLPERTDRSQLVTMEEACALLSVSRTTIYRLRRDGHLRAAQIGRKLLFRLRDLDAFVDDATSAPVEIAA